MLRTVLYISLLCSNCYSLSIAKPLNTIKVQCDETVAMGKCTWENRCNQYGYMCDSVNGLCCPVVDYTNDQWVKGPAIDGQCEDGFAVVNIPGGQEGGECVNILSIPGICPLDDNTEQCEGEDDKTCFNGYHCFAPALMCCPDDYSPPGFN